MAINGELKEAVEKLEKRFDAMEDNYLILKGMLEGSIKLENDRWMTHSKDSVEFRAAMREGFKLFENKIISNAKSININRRDIDTKPCNVHSEMLKNMRLFVYGTWVIFLGILTFLLTPLGSKIADIMVHNAYQENINQK